MNWWDQMPWSLFFECWVLSQFFLRYHCIVWNHRFIPMFSSKRIIVLAFAFKSVTCLELNFVWDMRQVFSFIYSMWISSCPTTIYWKDYSLFHLMVLSSLSKINWQWNLGFISGLMIPFHWYICLCSNVLVQKKYFLFMTIYIYRKEHKFKCIVLINFCKWTQLCSQYPDLVI